MLEQTSIYVKVKKEIKEQIEKFLKGKDSFKELKDNPYLKEFYVDYF